MPRTTIADAAAALLSEHRALSADELGRLIAERRVTRAKNPTQAVSRALNADPRFRRLSDWRWMVPAQLLNGATLTHRLTPEEAKADVLALTPDLAPLVALAPGELLLPDGRSPEVLWDADAAEATGGETDVALRGPSGWLSKAHAGSITHVRLTGAILRILPGPEPGARSRLAVRRLIEAARRALAEPDAAFLFLPPTASLETLVLDALADDPGLLEHPLPPLGEALAAGGLEVHRSFVGLPGTDWPTVDEWMSFDDDDLDDLDVEFDDPSFGDDDFEAVIAEELGLTGADAEGLQIALGAYELSQRMGGFEGSETHARLAMIFAFPTIARVLAVKAWTDADFEPFAAAVAEAATGTDAAGPRFVLAACAEARDDVAGAERLLRSALDADPDHPLALLELSRYETDRGDYSAALHHLRAAGAPPDDPERVWLERLTRPAVPKVGRNERCPCGSGRKYKACHLDSPAELGAGEMAAALLRKLRNWLALPNLQRLGEEVFGESGADELGVDSHVADALVTDIVLFDRDGLGLFLDVRGALLPDAERSLGHSWLQTRRSLYEVQAVEPGEGLTLRDLRAVDNPTELPDASLAGQVQPLDLVCMRLLPDGGGGVVGSDAIRVPRPQRRRILDMLDSGDALALLRWMATPAPAPQLTNTEGERLLFVTAEYRMVDPAAAAAALRAKLRDDGDDRYVETVERRGQDWIRGTITLDGPRATIEANSRKRMARLERTLRGAVPGAELIRREERTLEEAAQDEHGLPPEAIEVAAHPELAQAVDAFIRDSEARWVDEQIPALRGLTPRQAAVDQDARPELEALLDDMDWRRGRASGSVGLMDPSRVRSLLSMPERSR